MAPQLIQPSVRETLQIAGRNFVDLDNLIVLSVYCSNAANAYSTFRKGVTAAGYQVTAGKTLTLWAAKIVNSIVVAGQTISLGYADTDAGLSNTVSPTNPIWSGSTPSTSAIYVTAVVEVKEVDFNFQIPATKYPVIFAPAGTAVQMQVFGYEK